MGYSPSAKHAMLDELGTLAVWASLHVGDPGTTGANELTGGTPAYARKAITWGAAGALIVGEKKSSNQPVFDVPAGATLTFAGLWSASSGGTFYGSADIPSESFGSQGIYTLTEFILDLNA